jgi:hypothetical protein
MIDLKHIGYRTTPTLLPVDAWRVKLFCKAIGETDPVYWDIQTAQAAGYSTCPIPPTYLKAVEGDHCTSADLLQVLAISVKGVLHAEQSFTYFSQVYVDDVVEVSREIVDIYEKKSGAYNFVVVDSHFKVKDKLAASNKQVILIRNKATS